MVHSVQTKNHQGGISRQTSHESRAVLLSTSVLNRRNRRFVMVSIEILCTETQLATASIFPTNVAERKAKESDMIWHVNSPLGMNTLATKMKEIRRKSALALDCPRRTITTRCEQPPSHYEPILYWVAVRR